MSTSAAPEAAAPRAASLEAAPGAAAEVAVGAAPAEAGTSLYTKIVIALFFVTVFIPGSFYVGVRMTPFRLFLILMAVPMVLRYRADPTIRVTPVDVLVFLAIFWRSLSLVVNHQASELLNAAGTFLELFFGYMLGRTFIRSGADYRFFFKCFLVTLVAFLPFALLELVSFRRVLRDLFASVLVQPPLERMGPQTRFGMFRVQASFNHAIHFGMFCVIGVANLYYIYYDRFPRNILYPGFAAFMTLLALSSSSILTMGMQGILVAYETVLRPLRSKWVLLGGSAFVLWFSFGALVGMSPAEFLVSELVINQAGAEGRLDQITYGLKEIYGAPIFGIGLRTPALPFWRGTIFDNFWLATAVRSGLPAAFFIALAFVWHFWRIAVAEPPAGRDRRLRLAYMIPYATLMIALGGLSIYGIMLVFVMTYFGGGAWLYDRPEARPQTHRPMLPSSPAPRLPLRREAGPTRPTPPSAVRPRPSTGPYRGGASAGARRP